MHHRIVVQMVHLWALVAGIYWPAAVLWCNWMRAQSKVELGHNSRFKSWQVHQSLNLLAIALTAAKGA